jgi:hypothetical protein
MNTVVFLLIFAVVCVLAYYIVEWMKLPVLMDRILKAALGLLALFILLNRFGFLDGL